MDFETHVVGHVGKHLAQLGLFAFVASFYLVVE